jgi:hypothetical protein
MSGKTHENRPVWKGIFEVTSSIGLPLVTVLTLFKDRGYVVDWIDYYESALKHGMQSERVLSRIESDVSDVYGSEYRDRVLELLRFYISRK